MERACTPSISAYSRWYDACSVLFHNEHGGVEKAGGMEEEPRQHKSLRRKEAELDRAETGGFKAKK